jgi:hypothetical protein
MYDNEQQLFYVMPIKLINDDVDNVNSSVVKL